MGERVAGADKSMHKPGAFGKKVADAIAADPILSQRRSMAQIREHLAAEQDRMRSEDTKAIEIRLRDQSSWRVTANPMGKYTAETSRAANDMVDKIYQQLRDGAHMKFINDPKAKAEGPVEEAIKKMVDERRSKMEGTTYSSGSVGMKTEDGHEYSIGFGLQIPGIPARRVKLTNLDDEKITPEFEAASTRIGHMIHDEIESRVTAQVDQAGHNFDAAMVALEKAGHNPANINYMNLSNGSHSVSYKNPPPGQSATPPDEVQKEIVRIMTEHSVGTMSSKIHMANSETIAQRRAFLDVMREVQPMGGVLEGTPGHRTPKFKGAASVNEQVTLASARYPSSWTELSNLRGSVNFKQTTGRAHYRDFDSQVTLDGTVSTAVHEIGHRFEATVPGLYALERHFHDRRTKGETSRRMADLLPGHGYAKHEITYEDHFSDPYMGKVYKDSKFYEVTTMGMEAVAMGHGSLREDPDYSAFILGALATLVRP